MRLTSKSTALIVVFLTILLSITMTTFSQKKKRHNKKPQKVETKKDTTQKKDTLIRVDTVVIQKVNIDTTQRLKIDSVNEQISKTKTEIQKQLEILLTLNKSNFDSLNHVLAKRDTAFNLRLDTLVDQTKPEGFWEGFVKNSAYTWLYDTVKNLFTSNKDKSSSFFLRLLTFLAIVARFILLAYRLKEYFSKDKENDKPKKWRLVVSILSWLILVYSFSSYSQNKDEEYLENINDKLKQIEKKGNQQINAVAYTDNQFNSLLQAIDKKTNFPEQQLAEYKQIELQLKAQNENLAKSKKETETQISELKKGQADAEKNIVDKVKDYSTHGFWIFFLTLIIIFSKDIRGFFEKIYDNIRQN